MQDIIEMLKAAFGESYSMEGKDKVGIKELKEGYFNVAYEITLPHKAVILKIAPQNNIPVLSYEKNIMEAEVSALRLMEGRGVPVPKVYYYDNSRQLCDADYFFMEKVEGVNLIHRNPQVTSDAQYNKILIELGEYNKKMNELVGDRFGYLGQKENLKSNWKETFLNMIETLLEDGDRIQFELPFTNDLIYKTVEKHAGVLEEVKEARFVHWDLWEGNVFIKENKISGIIDFERALWGDPLMEYFFRNHSKNKFFNEGYGVDLRREHKERAYLYDIYLYLIMSIETKYRQYEDQGQYHFAKEQLIKAMDKIKNLG